jgi:hypothetical protein
MFVWFFFSFAERKREANNQFAADEEDLDDLTLDNCTRTLSFSIFVF